MGRRKAWSPSAIRCVKTEVMPDSPQDHFVPDGVDAFLMGSPWLSRRMPESDSIFAVDTLQDCSFDSGQISRVLNNGGVPSTSEPTDSRSG